MKLWKRNAVVAAIVLFICAAVYLNWSYEKENGTQDAGKTLGQAALVGGKADGLLDGSPSPAPSASQPQGGSSYFDSARLNRQQARDSALGILRDTAESENGEQDAKKQASAAIESMASVTVSEAQIENLVTAKGYTDCIAFMGENSISVVVSTVEGVSLTDADTARIMEIVTEETGLTAEQIKIIQAE